MLPRGDVAKQKYEQTCEGCLTMFRMEFTRHLSHVWTWSNIAYTSGPLPGTSSPATTWETSLTCLNMVDHRLHVWSTNCGMTRPCPAPAAQPPQGKLSIFMIYWRRPGSCASCAVPPSTHHVLWTRVGRGHVCWPRGLAVTARPNDGMACDRLTRLLK